MCFECEWVCVFISECVSVCMYVNEYVSLCLGVLCVNLCMYVCVCCIKKFAFFSPSLL